MMISSLVFQHPKPGITYVLRRPAFLGIALCGSHRLFPGNLVWCGWRSKIDYLHESELGVGELSRAVSSVEKEMKVEITSILLAERLLGTAITPDWQLLAPTLKSSLQISKLKL